MAEDSSQQKTPSGRVLKKSTSSTQNMKSQKSILGFFQKSSPSTSAASPAPRNDASQELVSSPAQRAASDRKSRKNPGSRFVTDASRSLNIGGNKNVASGGQSITPVPSSDAVGYDEGDVKVEVSAAVKDDEKTKESTVSAVDGGLFALPRYNY